MGVIQLNKFIIDAYRENARCTQRRITHDAGGIAPSANRLHPPEHRHSSAKCFPRDTFGLRAGMFKL